MDDFSPIQFRRYCLGGAGGIVALFIAVWIWLFLDPMAYFNEEYGIWQAKLQMVRDGQTGDVVILGDSRPTAALIPARLGADVTNLALPGITAIDAYYLSRDILAGAHAPKAVLLSISPSLFCDGQYYWSRSVGFGFLTPDQVDEVRATSRALNDTTLYGPRSPGDVDARLTDFLYSHRFPPYYFTTLVNARICMRYASNEKMYTSVLAERGHAFFGRVFTAPKDPDFEASLKTFATSKVIDAYFARTLALYQAHNIQVYFLSMPHTQYSDALYPASLRSGFATYLDNYQERFSNFHLLGDPFLTLPAEDFGDAYHLNQKGALVWSDEVAKMLNNAQVPGGPFGAD